MKQKRKVKSLLPQRKDKKTSFLTTLLLVLSTILCIGSASLLTSSVFAADPNFINYEGLPNNAEVLYNLKFADPEDLTGDGVADVYVHDNSLYISGTVITSGSSNLHRRNIVKTGVNSHILGGENNAVNSENVTVIAGYNNLISGGANSTMLGGISNSYSTGVVSIGGQNNEIPQKTYKEGIVLIGGRQNYIDVNNYAQRNIFLLGGQKNVPNMTGSNIIIGGSGVEITSNPGEINNIFIFSSSAKNFNAQEGKTFYLNMDNGVGIGTSGVPGGLSVNGALGLSNQEYSPFCNSGNIGVIYSLKGCMIGCTKASLEQSGNPFELLSLNEECKNTLADYISSKKVFYQEEIIPETPSYTGYCTHVNFTGHTVPCSTPSVYQNVIFETSIVDYGECTDFLIKNGENKCVFACEKGYHLGYDNDSTYGGFGTGCYADCRFGSDNELPLRHNQTGTLYDVTTVRCSDGEQCKTCGSHAKNVICKNGTVMEYSGGIIGGVIDTSSYKYSECTLRGGYDCPSNGYNITGSTKLKQYFVGGDNMEQVNLWHHVTGALTEDEIEMIRTAQSMGVGLGPKKQNNTIITPNINTIINPKDMEIRESPRWQNVNRSIITSTSTGARGIYQLCKYYNNYKDSPDREGVYKNPNTDCGTPINLYKLIGCTPGYTFTGGTCRPKCESFLTGQKNTYHVYGTILTGYKNRSVSCPNKNCEYAAFKCVDDGTRGVWEPIAGFEGKKPEDYKYERCDVDTKTCGEGFVLQAGDLERFKNRDFTGYQNSIYTGCTIIERNNGNCETGSTYYKLDGCKTNYHTENNEYCIYNYRSEPCPDKPDNAVRVHESQRERNHITLVPGQYGQSWDEDAWTSDIQPPEACKWKCIDGYHKEGSKCVKNQCTIPDDTWVLLEGSDENVPVKDMPCTLYATKGEAGDNPCACICDYERNYFIENGACTRHSNVCGSKEYICISPLHEVNTGETASGYTWDCYLDDIEIDNCVLCKDGYTKIDGVCVINTTDTVGKCGSRAFECLSGEPTEKVILPWKKGYTWECIGTKTSDKCSFERNDCISYSAKCEKNNYNACNNFWYNNTNTYNASNKDDCISRGVGYNTDGTYHKAVSGDNSYDVYFSPCFDWVETYPSCTFNGEVLTGDACFNIAIHGTSKLSPFPYEGCYRIDWTTNKEYMPRDWGYIYNDSKEIIGSIEGSIDKTNLTRTGTSIEVHRPPQTGYMIRVDDENLKNLTGKDLFIVANGDTFSQESLLYKFRIDEWTKNTDYPPHFYEIKSWSRYGADEEKVAEDFVGSGIIVNPNGYIYVYEKGVFKKVATIPNYYTKMELEATIFHPICNTIDNDYSIANPNAGQRDCLPKIGDLLSGNVNFPRYNNRLLYIPGNGASWYRLQFDDSGIVTRMERRVYSMLIE